MTFLLDTTIKWFALMFQKCITQKSELLLTTVLRKERKCFTKTFERVRKVTRVNRFKF